MNAKSEDGRAARVPREGAQAVPERFGVAGRDTGGRTYTAHELTLVRRSWAWPDSEAGELAAAKCSLELARDDIAMALKDFEATGTRPGWVAETRTLHRRVSRLLASVGAELDS